jgi:natural product precursor
MKKLNKLQINSEKLMKNEELVTLRGGYGAEFCGVQCSSDSQCAGYCSKCHVTAGGWPRPECAAF